MREENYGKWLKAKSEVEHFDELDDDVKEAIYNAEQLMEDEWEVELDEILLEEQEIYFSWIGFETEVKRLQKECGYDEEKACEVAETMSADVIQDLIAEYRNGLDDWEFSAG